MSSSSWVKAMQPEMVENTLVVVEAVIVEAWLAVVVLDVT
jgi:hypothetical protein